MWIAPALALALLAGCGGGSSNDAPGPEEKFLGRWQLVDGSSTAFTLSCPNGTPQPYLQWFELLFEHGTVTDLSETSGLINSQLGCSPALSYDVMGDTASIVNPDPYQGGAPFCEALAFDNMGNPVAILEFKPGTDWAFVLSAEVADKPPQGVLKGSATVIPWVPDATTNMLVAQAACSYASTAAGDAFFRMTQR
jgi:hypothetical protein